MAFQGDSIYWVEVEKIVPNPFQPRREFDEQKLRELADSVRMYGILQPLTVTRNEIQREDGTFYTEYELIAGERRLRASKLAGLTQVPVIIREGDDSEQEKLELAIIENLQREDLNAIDRALAFRQLAEVFGLSHTQVAKKVGRSREYVSNSIRLLGLPDYMQSALRQGEMSEGHARTLLMLNDRPEEQDVVYREILLKKLSVREVERIVRKIATDKVRKKDSSEFDTELIEMEKKFMETLGTRVQIQKTDYGGRLTIDYFSVEDLESMLTRMKVENTPTKEAVTEQFATLVSDTPLRASVAPVVAAATPAFIDAPDPLPYVEAGRFEELMNANDAELITETVPETAEVYREVQPEVFPQGESRADYFAPVSESVVTESEVPWMQSNSVSEISNEVSVLEQSDVVTLPNDVEAPEVIEALVSEVAEVMATTPEVVAAEPSTVNAPETPANEDESDLYSIRHFSV